MRSDNDVTSASIQSSEFTVASTALVVFGAVLIVGLIIFGLLLGFYRAA